MLPNVRALTAHVCDPWVNVVYVDSAPYPVCGLVFFFSILLPDQKSFFYEYSNFLLPKIKASKIISI